MALTDDQIRTMKMIGFGRDDIAAAARRQDILVKAKLSGMSDDQVAGMNELAEKAFLLSQRWPDRFDPLAFLDDVVSFFVRHGELPGLDEKGRVVWRHE